MELSDDLNRYLAGHPVLARKDTVTYRASKFLRRNWLPAAAGAVLIVSLITGAIAFAWQARRAQNRFNQVRKLAHTVLFDIHDQIANLAGSTPARRTIVRTSLEYLASLSADSRDDPTLQAELAEAYLRVGDVQGNAYGSNLGDVKGAVESYQHAVDLYGRAAQARPNDIALQDSFAKAFLQLGKRQFASADTAGARRSLVEAQRLFDRALEKDSSNAIALAGSAGTYEAASRLSATEGDYVTAIAQASKAVAIARRMLDSDPSNLDRMDSLADNLSQLGSCFLRTGETEKAVDVYRPYIQLREQLVEADPQNAVRRRLLMIASSRLGEVLGYPYSPNVGDVAGARVQFERMLNIAESLAAADPANKTAQMDLAQANLRMGGLLVSDEPKTALPHLRKALELMAHLAQADTQTLAIQENQGFVEGKIGAILAAQGQLSEGIARMRSAVRTAHAVLDRQPKSTDRLANLLIVPLDLAPALARSHDRAGVDALAADMSPFIERLHPAGIPNRISAAAGPRALFAFGESYALLNDPVQACQWFHQSVASWRELDLSRGVAAHHRALQADAIRRDAACLAANKK